MRLAWGQGVRGSVRFEWKRTYVPHMLKTDNTVLSASEETLAHGLHHCGHFQQRQPRVVTSHTLVHSRVRIPRSGVFGGSLLRLTAAFRAVHTVAV